MTTTMRLFRIILLIAVTTIGKVSVSAQMMYTTEAGVYGGASYVTGDVAKKPLEGMQADWGLTFRYVFNQRIALHVDYHQTHFEGNFQTEYPALYPGNYQLNNQVSMLDLTMAFNFFDYGYLEHVMYSSNITPYLFGGIGVIGFPSNSYPKLAFTLPFGLGVKIRLSPRLHLNTQWTHRLLSGTDNAEGVDELNDPLRLNGSNRLNRDSWGSFSIGISVGLTQRDCQCQKYQ